jgi:hypothetical protein
LSARYKRRSLPLLGLLGQIGLALAGRAGSGWQAFASGRTNLLLTLLMMKLAVWWMRN